MKLRPQQKLPLEQLRLTVPGEVMHELRLYQQYQAEVAQTTWEPKELATEILRAFLVEGDRQFLLWRRTHTDGVVKQTGTAEAGQGEVRAGEANASVSPAPRGRQGA